MAASSVSTAGNGEAGAQAHAATAAHPKGLVFDHLALLARVDEDWETLKLVVEAFCKDAPRLLQGVADSLAAQDLGATSRWGHALRGSSATVGADALCDLAAALETAGRQADTAAAGATLVKLQSEFKEFCCVVNETLQRAPGTTPRSPTT